VLLRSGRRRSRWLRVVVVVLAILGAHRVLGASPAGVPASAAVASGFAPLSIYLPAEVVVGDSVVADVVGAAPAAAVSLLVGGALGSVTLAATAGASGVARFVVPAGSDQWSGQVSLVARSGNAAGRGTFALLPGPVTGPLTTLIGSRSITADANDQAMGVVIPMDEFGNAPTEGTPIRFRRILPTGQVLTSMTRTDHLLAWQAFSSGTLAGTDLIHAEQGTATGPNSRLDEVAGPPVRFRIVSQRLVPAADGRSLLRLRSSVLQDRNGNVQADGTLVTLVGTGPAGSWRIPTSTVGGVARFTIETPVSPGTVQLVAHCRGSVSTLPLTITFAKNGSAMPATATRQGDDLIVTVGPVVDQQGAQVDDGARVTAVAQDLTGNSASGSIALVDGSGRLRIPSAQLQGRITVSLSLLGIKSTFTVS
jgi:hypothetical protein